MEVRLQKLIAGTGIASRRKAEEMIAAGRVMVNGKVVRELGTKVDAAKDHVKVDGRHIPSVQPYVYVLLHKPKNVMSTLHDPEGRPTVKDFLPGVGVRVFPVGRLDFDGEGLMLLTNNGELAQALLHPRYHVPKTYLVKVKGVLERESIEALESGVQLDDGMTAPAQVKKIRKAESNSWVEITIHEGRTHQVKRMLQAVDHPVLKLVRVRMGSLTLGHMAPGEYRFLTDHEANTLRDLVKRRMNAESERGRRPARPQRRSVAGPSMRRTA
ncbi:MAG TPA: pseudouridine synthase [Nitrospiraceae bacterium]|nr:pseudouridine synthase [Nitrospiraceae bacterium]